MADEGADATRTGTELIATASEAHTLDRSKDKGKGILLEEDTTDVMNLKPNDLTKPLELRVYRKWVSRNVPDPNPTGLCFILLDKQVIAKTLHMQIQTHISGNRKEILTNTCVTLNAGWCYPGERPALGHAPL